MGEAYGISSEISSAAYGALVGIALGSVVPDFQRQQQQKGWVGFHNCRKTNLLVVVADVMVLMVVYRSWRLATELFIPTTSVFFFLLEGSASNRRTTKVVVRFSHSARTVDSCVIVAVEE